MKTNRFKYMKALGYVWLGLSILCSILFMIIKNVSATTLSGGLVTSIVINLMLTHELEEMCKLEETVE